MKIRRYIKNYFCNAPLVNLLPRKNAWIAYLLVLFVISGLSYYIFIVKFPANGMTEEQQIILTVVCIVFQMLIMPLLLWLINAWFHMCDGIRDSHREFVRALKLEDNPNEAEFLSLVDRQFPKPFNPDEMVRGASPIQEDSIIVKENKVRDGIRAYLDSILSTYLTKGQIDALHGYVVLVRSSDDLQSALDEIQPICLDDTIRSRVTRKCLLKNDLNALAYNLKPLLKVQNPELYSFFAKLFPKMYGFSYKQTSFSAALTRDRHADISKNYDQAADFWFKREIEGVDNDSNRKTSGSHPDEIKKLSDKVMNHLEAYMVFLASKNSK